MTKLTARHIRAACQIAEDLMSDAAIAKEAKISRQALALWKKQPLFIAEVEQYRQRIREEAMQYGVASVGSQIARLNEHRKALLQVIAERAAEHGVDSETVADWHVAGCTTGMIVRNLTGVGRGEDYTIVNTYQVDISILAELREIELQALKITGQLVNKQAIQVTPKMLIGVDIDEV